MQPAPSQVPPPSRSRTELWRPVLTGNLASQALQVSEVICQGLPPIQPLAANFSLASGEAGFSLLLAYASLASQEPNDGPYARQALARITAAVESLTRHPSTPSLFSGYSGVAWVVDHLTQRGFLAADEDLNENIDAALLGFLQSEPWIGPAELITGLAGIGLYALDRLGRGQSPAVLDRVLDLLERKAKHFSSGMTWFDRPETMHPVARELYPNGCFNLGVSHGLPGVLGFLAEASKHGYARAQAMLGPAFEWLIAQRDLAEDGSYFGSAFEPGSRQNPRGNRLSWCYGDLGIVPVLLLAAEQSGNARWLEEALGLAEACCRRPDARAGIRDGGLCHGAFGNGHIFSRIFNATGMEACREQALNFYSMGLGLRKDGVDAGGFLAYYPPAQGGSERSPWVPRHGLLEGAAGIALALLAAATPVEPQWDRHLLIPATPKEFEPWLCPQRPTPPRCSSIIFSRCARPCSPTRNWKLGVKGCAPRPSGQPLRRRPCPLKTTRRFSANGS